jgi:hypothetical protein
MRRRSHCATPKRALKKKGELRNVRISRHLGLELAEIIPRYSLKRPGLFCPPLLFSFQVSWFRVKTKDILTVDDFTFIADDRISARWVPKTSTSLLEISKVQQDDEGVYECQVSTDPKKSRRVHLTVRGNVHHLTPAVTWLIIS